MASAYLLKGLAPMRLMVILLFGSTMAMAQQTISGIVTDAEDDNPLIGVNILLQRTGKGTITDFDGRYELEVREGDTLTFTYTGYEETNILVGKETTLDLKLRPSTAILKEVVVVGYSKVRKEDITGVVSKIDDKVFNKGVIASPDQLLNGKVAGVNMTASGGEPGAQVNIRIRGGTSLSASNQPLFVIDGIPIDNGSHNPSGMSGGRNPLNFINPSDIADITVLKDASAAAIYGSRGANGVIIITTKSGGNGKMQLTYDGSYGLSLFTNPDDFLNINDFIFTVERRAPRWIPVLGEHNTDWVDEVTQQASNQNHNLSLAAGSKTNSIRVALNYQDINGLVRTSNSNRLAASVNASQRLFNDQLTISLNTKHALNRDRFAPNVIGSAFFFDPTQSVRADNPAFGDYFEFENALAPVNPVSTLMQTYDIGRSIRNLVGVSADYKLPFLPGVTAKVKASIDRTDGRRQIFQPATLKGFESNQGGFIHEDFEAESNLLETFLEYRTQVADLKMDWTAGYSYQDFYRGFPRVAKIDTIPVTEYGIDNPEEFVSDEDLAALRPILRTPIFDRFENRLISFWGRGNFSYKDKYLLTATLRRDGSTRFAEGNRWGLFPALALGWKIIDEPFAKRWASTFSDLKLRASWGVTGSQEIPDYLYVNLYEQGDELVQVQFGDDRVRTLRPNAVDPNIKWEETSSINIGVDLEMWEGRLAASFDVYEKRTTDLLFLINFPAGTITGDAAITNIGAMQNRGFEATLSGRLISNENWSWSVDLNAATNRNEITQLDNGNSADFIGYQVGNIAGQGFNSTIQILRVGAPAYSFFVREHLRDAAGNPLGDGQDFNDDGLINDLDIYKDQNGDGVINEKDLVLGGSPWPDWSFGLTSNLSYKKFDLQFTLRAQVGGEVYNNVASANGAFSRVNSAFSPNNIQYSAYAYDFREPQVFSDVYLESADFLRLDNVTLGYNFSIGEKLPARVYLTGTNLLLFTPYSGVDPEAGPPPGALDPNVFGIDNNLYPRGQSVLFGLNLKL